MKESVWSAARSTVAAGMPTRAWAGVLFFERMIEAPVSGLVASYGMTLRLDLTMLQVASCPVGFPGCFPVPRTPRKGANVPIGPSLGPIGAPFKDFNIRVSY